MRIRKLRLNITQKFIGYLMLLSIIPLLVTGVVSYTVASDTLHEEADRYTQQLIFNQRDYLDLQMEQVEALITNLSGVDEIRTRLENAGAESNTYDDLTTQAQIGYILNSYINLAEYVSIDIFTTMGKHYHVGDTLNVENLREDVKARIFE